MDRRRSGPDPARWRRLGRLLPAEVRERVFEPAFGDLFRAWLTSPSEHRAVPFGVRVLAMYARCFPVALPRLVVRKGRLTVVGRLGIFALAAAVVVVVVIVRTDTGVAYGP